MIKHSVSIFLCFLASVTFAAKKKAWQDTTATNTVATNMLSDSLINDKLDDLIPTVTLEDVETNDEGGSDQGIAPVLNAGRDPFMSAASFNFSIARFRIRGYDNDYFDTYMNGIPTEYIDNGFGAFNLWAGLNDVTRNRDNSLGLKPSTLAFGSIGAIYSIDSRASRQRKQLSVTLGASNRTYDMRAAVTYGSGISKKGWSFAVSLVGRWAKSGYIKGTSMQSISYFASVEKMFKKHALALTVFGAPTKQGKSASTTQEAYDLAGSNYYNPAWGYQNGKIRNSRIEYRHQPTMILTHEWKPKDNMNLLTAAGYSFGERSVSSIDRNTNVEDPRPDYYKYLPSYFNDSGDVRSALLYEQLKNNPDQLQLNWARLYDVNNNADVITINNLNGVSGNSVTGKNAVYIVGDNSQFYHRFNFNTVYNVSVKTFDITAGLTYQFQKVNNYKKVKDLLGGDFYLDQNAFTDDSIFTNQDVTFPDLNNPNRVVKVGDKYGYNYASVVHKTSFWAQVNHHTKHIDWFAAAEFSNTAQYREGYYRNGLTPNESEGKSKTYVYNNYALKAGLTYKINGRHYLYANGSYLTRAPFWDNLFISPRVRHLANGVESEKVGSFEGGYIWNSPKFRLRASGFFTDFKDGANVLVYFDDDFFGLASYTLTNIDKRHYGGELGFNAELYKGLSLSLAASVGKFYYTSRQIGTLTIDNLPNVKEEETIYSKNFYVPNVPQQAYSLGLNYRSKKYWFVSATVNFFDRFYTEIAPTHRTVRATDQVPYQSEQWNGIITQERYNKKGQWTLDVSGGYTWRLHNTFKKMDGKFARKYEIVINAGIANLTNNRKFIVSGREQLRFDYTEKNPEKFPARYTYAFGINFYANLTFRF